MRFVVYLTALAPLLALASDAASGNQLQQVRLSMGSSESSDKRTLTLRVKKVQRKKKVTKHPAKSTSGRKASPSTKRATLTKKPISTATSRSTIPVSSKVSSTSTKTGTKAPITISIAHPSSTRVDIRTSTAPSKTTAATHTSTSAPLLSSGLLQLVKTDLASVATDSWVIGTQLETLTEYDYPDLSVYGSTPFPVLGLGMVPNEISAIVQKVLARSDGTGPLTFGDGATGDPASLGTGYILASYYADDSTPDLYAQPWTAASKSQRVGDAASLVSAVYNQLQYLLVNVTRDSNGAISHRADQTQLWSDNVYMSMPFIAYYGVATGNRTMLQLAVTQCQAYFKSMTDSTGTMKHIVGGSWGDGGHWATGNAWTAAGMLRVLATVRKSPWAASMASQQASLVSMVQTVVSNSWKTALSNGALPNYPDTKYNFADAASTALMASATYRLAAMGYASAANIDAAERGRMFVQQNVGSDGWLAHVVDPLSWNDMLTGSKHSPEAQAFVLLMSAAYRDWRT
ncbi:uncharacterized protein L969DRAFT_51234 [Mixia osmundae IAM 14324]|uniref:Six-hairpin glycosidase n=1 Tax=Mixia osmundae (strain CBS 9802 / IAM 14324 / JCM 22182 / KY 12970) TaxID=764103 RepID=G7EAM6_MIXOS|nr:uncharacterized protein L969DRAFT_51234 [Mixia osmundae IAM 14324]KEI38205.1 hypothetical protein L969DRAFT_51234 [Mixia osmundae IAM 14324]GAA99886.1 hypothetical protein E5Q_06589 [Mixia osmundae IAM 14324]